MLRKLFYTVNSFFIRKDTMYSPVGKINGENVRIKCSLNGGGVPWTKNPFDKGEGITTPPHELGPSQPENAQV